MLYFLWKQTNSMEDIKLESVLLPESEDFYDSIYCEKCQCLLRQPCWSHAEIMEDENVVPLSIASLPAVLCFGRAENERGIFAKTTIRPHTIFGPLVAPPLHPSEISSGTIWKTFQSGRTLAFNMDNDKWCNWMKHVTVVGKSDEQNMKIYLHGEDVIFVSVKIILPGEELRVAVGHNWAMRTCGNSSKRMTFGDLKNLRLGCGNSIQDNIPVFAMESHDSILTSAQSVSNLHVELPACGNEPDENGLPCASDQDALCISFPDLDVSLTALPPLDSETHSEVPSLPSPEAEERPTSCGSFQCRYGRESSPEYPFLQLPQLNISTLISHCQQDENEVGDGLFRNNSSKKSDPSTKYDAFPPVPESTNKQRREKTAVTLGCTSDGAVEEREGYENITVDGTGCFDTRDEVCPRTYSLSPRAAKTAATYKCRSEHRKRSCPAEDSLDDDMVDDSDVDAGWLVSDYKRHSSTESEELLDYESPPPTKKSESSHRWFKEKDTKNSVVIATSFTMPTIAAPIISAKATDNIDVQNKPYPTLEMHAEPSDTLESNTAIRSRSDARQESRGNYPSDIYRFKCPECSLHFRHDLLLQWHRQLQHSAIVDEPWVSRRTCVVCTKVCVKNQKMMRHVEEHGVKPSRIKYFVSTGDPSIMRYVPGGGGSMVVSDRFPARHDTHELCFMHCAEECRNRGCSLRFCSESLLDIHVMKHSPPKTYEGTLVCPGCQYQADNPQMLFEHVGQHGAARKDRKLCWRCSEFVIDMNQHAAHVHKEEYKPFMSDCPFACDQCEQRCRTSTALKSHRRMIHDARLPQCYICAKQFPSARILKEHSEEHRTSAGLVCPTCQKSFQSFDGFLLHTKRHNPKGMSICSLCQAIFTSPERLHAHKTVHETDYKHHCDQCEKSFKRSCNLWQHKKQVHSDFYRKVRKERKEERQKKGIVVKYVCPRRTLHYEDYPFKCEECRLGWMKLGALEQHKMRKHPLSGST